MFFKIKYVFILTVMGLTLSGCGDLLGTKAIKKTLDSSQFSADCELDVNEFSKIMTEHIGPQIRCLGENLNLFIKLVESAKPGTLSRIQLESYIKKHRPEIKPEVVNALKSVFDISHLITGEDPNFVSKESVEKVINFALVFNAEAAREFGSTFQNDREGTFELHQNHRTRVSKANKNIVLSLLKIFNKNRNGQIHKLNIIELMESFSTDSNRDYIDKIKKVMFVKSVLLGGDKEVITHFELERLIMNFDHLSVIALDIVRYKHILLDQSSILQLLKLDVTQLSEIMTQGTLNNRNSEVLFTIEEAMSAVKMLVSEDDFNVDKFEKLIKEAKKIVMGGNETEVKGLDLKNLMNHAKSILTTGTIFHRIYQNFSVSMESPLPVTVNFDEYRHTYPEHQDELTQFERIVKKYRFMKGEFISPWYTRGYKRNAEGVFEIALFEYAIKLVFKTFGSPSPNGDSVGGFSMDKDQMQKLLIKFQTELIELDMLTPGRAEATADNVSLLGSLFQFQSDKNKVLDINEATEFGTGLFTAIGIAEDLMAQFKKKGCALDQYGRVEPDCFRANFWPAFCEEYRDNYPLMFESMNAPASCADWQNTNQSILFLDTSIRAARTCVRYTDGQKEEIYYSESDMMTIMIALLSVETTILRWDTNNNNYMDADEVNKAYDIYSPALDGFLEDKPAIIKKFKKQIYQYMIKYEQVPDEKDFNSIWKFIKFLLSFDKKAPAQRKTIASILVAISEQNVKMSTTPAFNCNYLRDPTNIPSVPAQLASSLVPVDTRPDYSSILELVKVSNPNAAEPEFHVENRGCFTLFNREYCLLK